MGVLLLVKMLMKNQWSHKVATAGSMMGVLISVAFISGIFITSEVMVSSFFEEQVQDLDEHFTAFGYPDSSTIEQAAQSQSDLDAKLRSFDYVEEVSFRLELGHGYYIEHADENLTRYLSVIGTDNIGLDEYTDNETGLPTDGYGMVISTRVANDWDLDVGDSINLTIYQYEEVIIEVNESMMKNDTDAMFTDGFYIDRVYVSYNFTMTIEGIVQIKQEHDDQGPFVPGSAYALMGIEGLFSFLERVGNVTDDYYHLMGMISIKVDMDHFSNLDDPFTTQREVRSMKIELERVLQRHSYHLGRDRLSEEFSSYTEWSVVMRIFFVVTSIPLFLLCFYLILVGSRIGMESKMEEIALLKVKGARNRHVFFTLLVESIGHGAIGAFVGVILGSILSLFFITLIVGTEMEITDVVPNPIDALVLIIISSLIVTAIRLRSMIRLSRLEILQAIRGSPERKEKKYRPTFDIVILSAVAVLVGSMIYFNIGEPEGPFLIAIYYITEILKPLLLIFLPFLLILSMSRFFILGIPSTIPLVSKLMKPLNPELFPMLVAGLKFRERRVATMAILISITLAFGTLTLSQMETRHVGAKALVDASIPTDLYVAATGVNYDMTHNLTLLSGVNDVVAAQYYHIRLHQEGDEWSSLVWGKMIGVDMDQYRSTVSPSSDLLLDGRWIGTGTSSPNEVHVILNKRAADSGHLLVGDRVNVSMEHQPQYGSSSGSYFEEVYIICTVVGIVDHLPGLRSDTPDETITDNRWGDGENDHLTDRREEPVVYILEDDLPEEIVPSLWAYLVDVDGSNEDVEQEIASVDWKEGPPVVLDKEKEMERIWSRPANKGTDLILVAEFLCILVAVIVGIILIQIVQNTSRTKEFAEIIARGATRTDIFKLLLSETLVVLIVGMVIGTATGFLVSYSFQSIFSVDWTSSITGIVDPVNIDKSITVATQVQFPPTILLIYILTLVMVIISTALISYAMSKIDVASNLRLRRT